MKTEFASRMGQLRREKRQNQREAAAQLGISQALLSHYENGAREPKFEFVLEACDYYEVTADYLLGRTSERKSGAEILSKKVQEIATELEVLKKEETDLLKRLESLL